MSLQFHSEKQILEIFVWHITRSRRVRLSCKTLRKIANTHRPSQRRVKQTDSIALFKLKAGHSIKCITHADHSIAFTMFYTLWPYDLDLWPFGVILTDWQRLMTDYPCDKFGDRTVSAVLVLSCGQTDRHTHTHRRGWSPYSRDCRRRE